MNLRAAKLSSKEVTIILKKRKLGHTVKKLSIDFKVSKSCIESIIYGNKWIKNKERLELNIKKESLNPINAESKISYFQMVEFRLLATEFLKPLNEEDRTPFKLPFADFD